MRSLRAIVLISIIFLSTPWFPNLFVAHGQTAGVWNFTERGDYDRTIGLFMNDTWQMVELVNSTLPVETIKNDEDGNPVAVLSFPKSMLQPSENLSFTVWYHIVSKPRIISNITETESLSLADIPQNLVDEYTRGEGSWQTDNQQLVSLSSSLRGSETNVLTIVKNFIGWMTDPQHMKYPKDRHENPYYPNQTYALKEGDCDDQTILLVTLCRIVGIPSYLQIGCIYMPRHSDDATIWNGCVSFVERRVGWHGWAFVYIPPWGWLPVDLTYVPEGLGDPLNAIKHGAVTLQNTTQYMNVIHSDYVGASLEAREFLVSNGFQVYAEDEMMQEVKQDSNTRDVSYFLKSIVRYSNPSQNNLIPIAISMDPLVPIALIVLTVFAVFSLLLVFRRLRKRKPERNLPQTSPVPCL